MTDTTAHTTSGPSQRSVEIGVALAAAIFGVVVILGSLRVGIGWGAEGPKSGFFPFYIGLLILGSSGVNLVEAWQRGRGAPFAEWNQLGKVLSLLVPTAVYVGVIPFAGIYVSSVVLIAGFMVWLGHYRALVSVAIAIATMIAIYLTFEKWFLVPLPKGPLEDWLGL